MSARCRFPTAWVQPPSAEQLSAIDDERLSGHEFRTLGGCAPIPGIAVADFKDAVTVLNVWASWCVPCHDEAPLLLQLAQDTRLRLIGINYKDDAGNARRFLGRYGNPFVAAGTDDSGRAAIEWGVYGVPETFVVGRDARIAYKLVGPITADNFDTVLKPQIEKALAAGS